MLNLGLSLLLLFSVNSLALPLLTSFRFSTPVFRFLSLCCKGCVSLGVCSLQSKLISIYSESHQPNFPPAIVQCPIVLVSSGFDDSSIPLLMFSIGIYILPSYILAVIYFVHCALSLIILFYICACCDTRCFKNVCLFLFVEVKALLGLCCTIFDTK